MPVRIYAQVVGVVLLLLGVLGLLLGERALLGIVNIDIMEDIVHPITGSRDKTTKDTALVLRWFKVVLNKDYKGV